MTNADVDRRNRVLLIFIENPGGLRFDEVKKIAVDDLKICSKSTLRKVLGDLTSSGLLSKDPRRNYTLGLIEPFAQIIREGNSGTMEQIAKFFKILYQAFDLSDKSQGEVFYKVGTSFLVSKVNRTLLTTAFLVPFFYDSKIRELCLYSQKFAFDALYKNWDEMSEKFLKKKMSHDLEITPEMEEYISSKLKEINGELARNDSDVIDSILKLNIGDAPKVSLTRLIYSKPWTNFFAKEEKSIGKLVRALKEDPKN